MNINTYLDLFQLKEHKQVYLQTFNNQNQVEV